MTDFSILNGMTLVRVEAIKDGDEAIFVTSEGRIFKQFHSQDCCESVGIAEIIGDLSDLIGSPITLAEETSHSGDTTYDWSGDERKEIVTGWPEGVPVPEYVSESFTWTFYKLSTIKGSVTIRWLGESNGYYSEGVDFIEVGSA